jgi:hypothetical protein
MRFVRPLKLDIAEGPSKSNSGPDNSPASDESLLDEFSACVTQQIQMSFFRYKYVHIIDGVEVKCLCRLYVCYNNPSVLVFTFVSNNVFYGIATMQYLYSL